MALSIRRIVTAHDADGKSVLVSHAWDNRSDAAARVVFSLMDAAFDLELEAKVRDIVLVP